ncbi:MULTISPECIES: hypothetical protein [unclassified Pseudoalteromonas]|uniref:hypothetical protein n=1 Tax=unclassified Pseudoalteromonas TaxID=194690 RepID=UPI000C8B810B|nr:MULTISPECIES: hypothetical protein [unclassified Pseudoalteromonas]QLE10271.1 hypothetical protein HYD28_15640 [Pseudoalteromonas shioyasakiensis]MAD02733.1 hypothetical protein [Pseudoalteromonas sp.]MCP4588178.1 hypothetical protein [Pseudoalteromonas sp.]QWV04053.1 hypothetical protein KQ246_11045 [Pseudoalteromonas shioyasakiensis]RZD21899.1 hypothetical protein EVU92_07450 [Pseudoalteromonas sp. MEBiC 03485]|tara:strand:- start:133 stop:465 length:333 start_codon:yes stop_codon:yes gene_type:complete
MSQERSFIKSGRNTIIHKDKKLDLVVVNGENHPRIKVTQNGLEPFKDDLPKNRREAKERYLEMVYVASPDVFAEEKRLLFIQALDGREYKVDYSKVGTKLFVRIHQESYL